MERSRIDDGGELQMTPEKDAFRLGCPRPTDLSLHPNTGWSTSGAVFCPCAAVLGVPRGREKGVQVSILLALFGLAIAALGVALRRRG
jgi:hypothetical protein